MHRPFQPSKSSFPKKQSDLVLDHKKCSKVNNIGRPFACSPFQFAAAQKLHVSFLHSPNAKASVAMCLQFLENSEQAMHFSSLLKLTLALLFFSILFKY